MLLKSEPLGVLFSHRVGPKIGRVKDPWIWGANIGGPHLYLGSGSRGMGVKVRGRGAQFLGWAGSWFLELKLRLLSCGFFALAAALAPTVLNQNFLFSPGTQQSRYEL